MDEILEVIARRVDRMRSRPVRALVTALLVAVSLLLVWMTAAVWW